MNKNKVKVILYGLGPIGIKTGWVLIKRPWIEIIGGIDNAQDKVGKDLGELLGLGWCDVDLDMASLSVVQVLHKRCGICKMVETKTSHSRCRIVLSPSLVLLLRQYKAEQQAQRMLLGEPFLDSALVFSHIDGRPLDPGVVSHTFAKVP